jgi:Family of unknown function (DUF6488)
MTVILSFAAAQATAHPGGHDDEVKLISAEEATTLADHALSLYVRDKKLDGSWAKRKAKEAKLQNTGSEAVWVVSYANPAEKDASKKTLYVFIDSLGNFIDANHSAIKLTKPR